MLFCILIFDEIKLFTRKNHDKINVDFSSREYAIIEANRILNTEDIDNEIREANELMEGF